MAGSTTSEKVGKEPTCSVVGGGGAGKRFGPIATNYYRTEQGVAMAATAQVRVGGNFIKGVRANWSVELMLEAELALQTSGGPGFQADSSMSRVSEDHQGGGKGWSGELEEEFAAEVCKVRDLTGNSKSCILVRLGLLSIFASVLWGY